MNLKVSHLRQNGGRYETERGADEFARQTSLFYAVPETTIEKIAASDDCEIKQYEKFSLVYGKTEFSRSLGIVLFGNLRVTKGNAGGHAMIMSTLDPGSIFGAAALFNEKRNMQRI